MAGPNSGGAAIKLTSYKRVLVTLPESGDFARNHETVSDSWERQKNTEEKPHKQNFRIIVPGFSGNFVLCFFSPIRKDQENTYIYIYIFFFFFFCHPPSPRKLP